MLREERYLSLNLAMTTGTEELINLPITDMELPSGCLVALIRRENFTFVPRGNATLLKNDRLTIIGDPEGISALRKRYQA